MRKRRIFKLETKVLLQQKKEDKLTAPFKDENFVVTERNGNQVTVESESGTRYSRNISHVKPLIEGPDRVEPEFPRCDITFPQTLTILKIMFSGKKGGIVEL